MESNAVNLNVSDAFKGTKLFIPVVVKADWRFRVAVCLIRLAAWILGARVVSLAEQSENV